MYRGLDDQSLTGSCGLNGLEKREFHPRVKAKNKVRLMSKRAAIGRSPAQENLQALYEPFQT